MIPGPTEMGSKSGAISFSRTLLSSFIMGQFQEPPEVDLPLMFSFSMTWWRTFSVVWQSHTHQSRGRSNLCSTCWIAPPSHPVLVLQLSPLIPLTHLVHLNSSIFSYNLSPRTVAFPLWVKKSSSFPPGSCVITMCSSILWSGWRISLMTLKKLIWSFFPSNPIHNGGFSLMFFLASALILSPTFFFILSILLASRMRSWLSGVTIFKSIIMDVASWLSW